jgi:hypothetical protein
MASASQIAVRRSLALSSIAAVAASIASRLQLDQKDIEPGDAKDPNLAETQTIENFGSFLEKIDAALAGKQMERIDPVPEQPPVGGPVGQVTLSDGTVAPEGSDEVERDKEESGQPAPEPQPDTPPEAPGGGFAVIDHDAGGKVVDVPPEEAIDKSADAGGEQPPQQVETPTPPSDAEPQPEGPTDQPPVASGEQPASTDQPPSTDVTGPVDSHDHAEPIHDEPAQPVDAGTETAPVTPGTPEASPTGPEAPDASAGQTEAPAVDDPAEDDDATPGGDAGTDQPGAGKIFSGYPWDELQGRTAKELLAMDGIGRATLANIKGYAASVGDTETGRDA